MRVAKLVRVGAAAAAVFAMAAPAAHARPSPRWYITKTHWSAADEKGFEHFVTAIGESDCSSSESCIRSPANPYRKSDPRWFDLDLDCAKLPYFLRAYYAWKNHLPFSFVSAIASASRDPRYGSKPNRPVRRKAIIDHGHGIDGAHMVMQITRTVYSATYRTDADANRRVRSDFYSPAIGPASIRPGTVIYDINGHVAIVYKVDPDGRIHYMDAHPDFTVTRSVYGAQFGQSPEKLGGGFKDWRPQRLAGAHRNGKGHLIGGHMVTAPSGKIPDFSLVQYRGTDRHRGRQTKKPRFAYNDVDLGFYEYVRAAVSGGRMTYNPIYELRDTMHTLCNDLNERAETVRNAISEDVQDKPHPDRLPDNIYGTDNNEWESYSTPARDVRLRAGFVQLHKDMVQMIDMWIHRDPRIVYDGQLLKQDLLKAYNAESQRCTITYLNSDKKPVSMTMDSMIHRLFRMSYDPYQCIEHRWGAVGAEAASCHESAEKQAWYAAQQRLRNDIDPDYQASMHFTLKDLQDRKRGTGSDSHPDIDVKALIDNMGDQVPFTGMATVGR